jgi:hypothetical protein
MMFDVTMNSSFGRLPIVPNAFVAGGQRSERATLLSARIWVKFAENQVSRYLRRGWGAKTVSLLFMLGLLFGILAVLSVVLALPQRIRGKQAVTARLMGSQEPALADEAGGRPMRERLLLAAHWVAGFMLPLSIWHVVDWNLIHFTGPR